MSLLRFSCAFLLVASAAGAQGTWVDPEPQPGKLPASAHRNDGIAIGLGFGSTMLAAANLAPNEDGSRLLAALGVATGVISMAAGEQMRQQGTAQAGLAWASIGLGAASASVGTIKLFQRARSPADAIDVSPTFSAPSSRSATAVGVQARIRF